jgi:hypothetical protein
MLVLVLSWKRQIKPYVSQNGIIAHPYTHAFVVQSKICEGSGVGSNLVKPNGVSVTHWEATRQEAQSVLVLLLLHR